MNETNLNKPKIFIASSVEGLDVAYALQELLDHEAEVTIWDQGVFQLTQSSLDSLIKSLDNFDFGIFVFTPDDESSIRNKQIKSPRDNVIFELGLFIGRLGKEHCFIVQPRGVEGFQLPSDLLGITTADYNPDREDGNLKAALGPARNKIRKQFIITFERGLLSSKKPVLYDVLEENQIEILKYISKRDNDDITDEDISQKLRISITRTKYYLEKLVEKGLLNVFHCLGNPSEYGLTKTGREYLIENNFID